MIHHHRSPITTYASADRPSRIGPSFQIRGSFGAGSLPPTSPGVAWGSSPLRLDRINSGVVLRCAREIYFRWLAGGWGGVEPVGVVLVGESAQGRVVFDPPVLLPDEQFVPIDLLRSRPGPRSRQARPPVPRPPA